MVVRLALVVIVIIAFSGCVLLDENDPDDENELEDIREAYLVGGALIVEFYAEEGDSFELRVENRGGDADTYFAELSMGENWNETVLEIPPTNKTEERVMELRSGDYRLWVESDSTVWFSYNVTRHP